MVFRMVMMKSFDFFINFVGFSGVGFGVLGFEYETVVAFFE